MIFVLLSLSNTLVAKRHRHQPNAAAVWEQALRGNDDVSYKSRHKRKHRYKHHRKKTKKRSASSLKITGLSNEKKLQKSLTVLGFYHGDIDGAVNEDATRQAIRKMNIAYRNEDTPFLDFQMKNELILLADLSQYNHYLKLKNKSKKNRVLQLQTALKVLGFYSEKIDGIEGPVMQKSIIKYKRENFLSDGDTLDFEEEYRLVSTAVATNQEQIKVLKEKLKILPENKKSAREEKIIQPVGINRDTSDTDKKNDVTYTAGNEKDKTDVTDNTNEEIITESECKTLVDVYDQAVIDKDTSDMDELESTANIIIELCNIHKTKTGDVVQTLKQLKTNR